MKLLPAAILFLCLVPTVAAAKARTATRRLDGHFSDPEGLFVHPNQVREKELFEMMNPLYQMNAMMAPFYRMYGMDPMTAVMHPYLMGNYRNPFLASGASPVAINKPVGQFNFGAGLPFVQNGYGPSFPQVPRKARGENSKTRFDPLPDPGITGNLQALANPGMGFSNNMPANGVMNPFINTAGMMNPFMNRSGVNPYYALTGATDTMIGSPFNNFGNSHQSKALLYKLSAMNPFVLGQFGLGSVNLNSGVGPAVPGAAPTNGHQDLDKI